MIAVRIFFVGLLGLLVKLRFVYLRKKNKNILLLGNNVKFYGLPILSFSKGSTIKIGNRAIFRSHSKYNPLGVNHPVILSTLSSTAEIIIGDEVGMSGGTICAVKRVKIGEKTLLGANVKIMDTDFHPICPTDRIYKKTRDASSAEVIVGENVFIGTNTVILKGSVIGNNSVIGAGSVVIGHIPANVIAAGNPCKVIRSI